MVHSSTCSYLRYLRYVRSSTFSNTLIHMTNTYLPLYFLEWITVLGNVPQPTVGSELANLLVAQFLTGEVDACEIIFTRFNNLISYVSFLVIYLGLWPWFLFTFSYVLFFPSYIVVRYDPTIRTLLPLSLSGIEAEEDEIFKMTTKVRYLYLYILTLPLINEYVAYILWYILCFFSFPLQDGKMVMAKQAPAAAGGIVTTPDYIFEDEPTEILNTMLTLYFSATIMRCMQESVASELVSSCTMQVHECYWIILFTQCNFPFMNRLPVWLPCKVLPTMPRKSPNDCPNNTIVHVKLPWPRKFLRLVQVPLPCLRRKLVKWWV